MPFIVLLTTFIFLCLAFVSTQTLGNGSGLLSYLLSELAIIKEYLILFVLGGIGLAVYFAHSRHVPREHRLHKRYLLGVYHTIQLTLLGFLLAYVLLFVVAFVELNIFAVIINVKPSLVGVTTNQQVILGYLATTTTPPKLIPSDVDAHDAMVAITSATSGTDNFYGKVVLPSIPGFLVIPIRQAPGSFLQIDDTIIVTKLVPKDLEAISPLLGYLYVQQYFWGRYIPTYPQVSVMTKKEYETFRKDNQQQALKNLGKEITHIDQTVSSVSAAIAVGKEQLTKSQATVTDAIAQQKADKKQCLGTGRPKAECTQKTEQWQRVIDEGKKETEQLTKQIQVDQETLTSYTDYQKYFAVQKKIAATSAGNVSSELGLFVGPDSIKIITATNSTHPVADYFETFVHEYLHYASYTVAQKTFTSAFFEEAFTEYFARNIIEDQMDITTDLGYPIHVKIMAQIAKAIPETELADVYFSKDDALLATTLDRVYGDGFYKKNQLLFELLHYTSDLKLALSRANTLLRLLGGEPITQKDLANHIAQ